MTVRVDRDGPVTTVIMDRPGVRNAVDDVLREGKKLTGDLGGTAGTTELAEAIASRV